MFQNFDVICLISDTFWTYEIHDQNSNYIIPYQTNINYKFNTSLIPQEKNILLRSHSASLGPT